MIKFCLFVISIAKFNLNKINRNISLCSRADGLAADHQRMRTTDVENHYKQQVDHVIMRFQCITIYRQVNHKIVVIIVPDAGSGQRKVTRGQLCDVLIIAGGNMVHTYYHYAFNIFKHHSMKTSDQQVFNSKNNHETHIYLPTWNGWSGMIKKIELTRCSDNQNSMDSTPRMETHLMNFTIRHCRAAEELLKIFKIIQTMYVTFHTISHNTVCTFCVKP